MKVLTTRPSSSSEGETELAEARYLFGETALANERSASAARLKVQALRSGEGVQPRRVVSATLVDGKKKVVRKKRHSLVSAAREASLGQLTVDIAVDIASSNLFVLVSSSA
jgi:hypothetical protein